MERGTKESDEVVGVRVVERRGGELGEVAFEKIG